MKDPAGKLLLTDLGGVLGESGYNAWTDLNGLHSDPHNKKANCLMCDGHVEKNDKKSLTPMMFRANM